MKFLLIPLAFMMSLAPATGKVKDLPAALNKAEQDLKASLSKLARNRDIIEQEKLPIARKLEAQRSANRLLKEDAASILQNKDSHDLSLSELQQEVQKLEDSYNYISNLFEDYKKNLDLTLNVPEKQLFEKYTVPLQFVSEKKNPKEYFMGNMNLVDASISRLRQHQKTFQFQGKAIGAEGTLISGNFYCIGPLSYFSGGKGVHGIIDSSNLLRPHLLQLSSNLSDEVSLFSKNKSHTLPIDVTISDATEIQRNETTMMDHVERGGIWIYPILSFAAISLGIAIFKLFDILSLKSPSTKELNSALNYIQKNQNTEASKIIADWKGPYKTLLVNALRFSDQPRTLLEEILHEKLLEIQPQLSRYLSFISITAATAPLLGLLGTVTGMIETFHQINLFGNADTQVLAGGIWEALITTEFGLIAAIPAFIIHAFLLRKCQGIQANLERLSTSVLNAIETKTPDIVQPTAE